MNNLLAVPVLLSMLGAASAFLAGRHPLLQRAISITAVAGVSAVGPTKLGVRVARITSTNSLSLVR